MTLEYVFNNLDSLSNYILQMIEEQGDIWSEYFIACKIAMVVIERFMDEHPEVL